jgi:Type 5 capsule protein repressor C-terminal domain
LVRVTDTWDAIEARSDELADAFLDLTVKTGGTDTSLAERAADAFPFLVKVRAYRAGSGERERLAKAARSWPELYDAFYRREHPGEDPPEALLTLLRDVLEEVGDATA